MTEKEILQSQIEEAKKRLQELEEQEKINKESQYIKQLSEYTTEEKVKWFDETYEMAKEEFDEVGTEDYCEDNDNAEYAWEHYMEILARDKNFWKYYNSRS